MTSGIAVHMPFAAPAAVMTAMPQATAAPWAGGIGCAFDGWRSLAKLSSWRAPASRSSGGVDFALI
jgi:hypothetical protein